MCQQKKTFKFFALMKWHLGLGYLLIKLGDLKFNYSSFYLLSGIVN